MWWFCRDGSAVACTEEDGVVEESKLQLFEDDVSLVESFLDECKRGDGMKMHCRHVPSVRVLTET